MRFSVLFALGPLLLLLLGGCAHPEKTVDPQIPYPPEREMQVGDIFHLPTGTFVSEEQMLDVVTDSRIVYVGETHDNPASHRVQLQVLEAMAERYPGRIALGLEMMTPAQQPVLDRWVAGEISEKELLKTSGWYEQWRMDFEYYRELFDFARRRGIPIVGLNAEKSLVRAVGRTPLEELGEEQRSELPRMDLGDPYQRAMVESVYGGHEHGESRLSGFLRVQTLWDETMAENIARYLQSPPGEGRRMVVLAGGNHVRHGFGIPRRVFRRMPTSYSLVGSREIDIPEDKQERLMDIETPDFPMPAYDFTVFTRYEDLGKERVRLGVVLDEDKEGVTVKSVLPGSVAEELGLRGGDVILFFDGEPVDENFDLIYAVSRKEPGDEATLRIERAGEVREFEVVFRKSAGEGNH